MVRPVALVGHKDPDLDFRSVRRVFPIGAERQAYGEVHRFARSDRRPSGRINGHAFHQIRSADDLITEFDVGGFVFWFQTVIIEDAVKAERQLTTGRL